MIRGSTTLTSCILIATLLVAGDDARSVERLLADLANDDAGTRDSAVASLIERGAAVRAATLGRWQETKDPEVRARTLTVLQGIDEKEFLRLMAAFDSPSPGKPPAPSPADQAGPGKNAAPDVAALLAQASDGDWRTAERALLRLNGIAKGAIFEVSSPKGSEEMPEPFRRLLVLFARDSLARGIDGWGRLLTSGDRPALPATLRPLGPDDIRGIIARDPGKVTKGEDSDQPQRKTRADGGVYSYQYMDQAPFSPTGRVSPVGVVHQFTYDKDGVLDEWRVCPGNDQWWLDVRFVRGEASTITDSNGNSATFK